jgi:hypothetical protein
MAEYITAKIACTNLETFVSTQFVGYATYTFLYPSFPSLPRVDSVFVPQTKDVPSVQIVNALVIDSSASPIGGGFFELKVKIAGVGSGGAGVIEIEVLGNYPYIYGYGIGDPIGNKSPGKPTKVSASGGAGICFTELSAQKLGSQIGKAMPIKSTKLNPQLFYVPNASAGTYTERKIGQKDNPDTIGSPKTLETTYNYLGYVCTFESTQRIGGAYITRTIYSEKGNAIQVYTPDGGASSDGINSNQTTTVLYEY